MELLTYFLVLLTVYLGIVAGYVIMLVAPEEKKPGMKYFNFLSYVIFYLSIAIVILFSYKNFIYLLIVLALGIIFFLSKRIQLYFAYIFFSVFLYRYSAFIPQFLVFSALTFGFGIVSGAIIYDLKDKKKSFSKVLYLLVFILFSVLLKIFL
jgi:hypothetical protein